MGPYTIKSTHEITRIRSSKSWCIEFNFIFFFLWWSRPSAHTWNVIGSLLLNITHKVWKNGQIEQISPIDVTPSTNQSQLQITYLDFGVKDELSIVANFECFPFLFQINRHHRKIQPMPCLIRQWNASIYIRKKEMNFNLIPLQTQKVKQFKKGLFGHSLHTFYSLHWLNLWPKNPRKIEWFH